MAHLAPIRPAQFRGFLRDHGWRYDRTKGDHEAWVHEGCPRPVIFQSEGDIPVFILQGNLRTMGLAREDLVAWLGRN